MEHEGTVAGDFLLNHGTWKWYLIVYHIDQNLSSNYFITKNSNKTFSSFPSFMSNKSEGF